MGDASYSIYIVHGVALSALFALVNHLGAPRLLMIPIGGPIAVVIGLGVYRCVERPMTKQLRRRPGSIAVPVPIVPTDIAGTVDG
jgi:exopolysaccharide production protein ExoZ